ncbi:MAG: hypothetical protein PSW75_11510 [bacterium]|nr:hypothetical protein [bacterium]
MDAPAEKKSARKKGCLIFIVMAVALLGYSVWQIREPGRRAHATYDTIRGGMSTAEVEQLLTGRHYCVYQVQRPGGEWEIVNREDFAKLVAAPDSKAYTNLRLMLTFLGMSPGRVSFIVDLDRAGRVQKLNPPYNWD